MFLLVKDLINNRRIYIPVKTYKTELKFKNRMKRKQNKSLILEHFGDTPQLRVFDFLIGNFFFDFPMTEIARESNVSYNSIVTFFDKWIKKGLLVKTRKVGKSDYYKLNMDNSFVIDIVRLDWRMVKADIGLLEETKKPMIPVSNH